MTDVQQDRSKLAELIEDIPIAMFTTVVDDRATLEELWNTSADGQPHG